MSYKTQYNDQNNQYSGSNTYPKKTWNNPRTSNDSNGGFAKFISTKKDGCILTVELNKQNLVLKGFFQSKGVVKDNGSGWKLYAYYDKTKIKPQFNQPNPVQQNPMDDQLPQGEQQWSQGANVPNTDFDPKELEQELDNERQG